MEEVPIFVGPTAMGSRRFLPSVVTRSVITEIPTFVGMTGKCIEEDLVMTDHEGAAAVSPYLPALSSRWKSGSLKSDLRASLVSTG